MRNNFFLQNKKRSVPYIITKSLLNFNVKMRTWWAIFFIILNYHIVYYNIIRYILSNHIMMIFNYMQFMRLGRTTSTDASKMQFSMYDIFHDGQALLDERLYMYGIFYDG